jgi:small subunit ribosomal protein S16
MHFFSLRFSQTAGLYRANFNNMALKIRLQRHGASHRPFYRMVVAEAEARRDGRFVEVLGTYEPQASKPENELSVKLDRVDYWKSVGAKESDTAASLIRKARRSAPIAEATAEVISETPVVEENTEAAEPVAVVAAEAEASAVEASETVEAPEAPEAVESSEAVSEEAPAAEETAEETTADEPEADPKAEA